MAAMRYRIDFLMKHNITFSLAPGFFPFTLAQHKYAQRKESIQTRKKVKHPAIYQHWISKSGPISPDCWDFAIYESTFIYLFIMSGASVPLRGPQDGPLVCRESALWVWQTWRPLMELLAVCGSGFFEQPNVTNLALIKLAPNYQPQTQISFNLS